MSETVESESSSNVQDFSNPVQALQRLNDRIARIEEVLDASTKEIDVMLETQKNINLTLMPAKSVFCSQVQ